MPHDGGITTAIGSTAYPVHRLPCLAVQAINHCLFVAVPLRLQWQKANVLMTLRFVLAITRLCLPVVSDILV